MDKADEILSKISKPLGYEEPKGDSKPEEGKPAEEAPKEQPKPEPPKVDGFNLEEFTKRLGVSKVEDIEVRFKEYETLKGSLKEKEEKESSLMQELEGYKKFADEAVDPMSYFADEKGFFAETLRKKYPNLDYSSASKLVGKDVKDMDDFEAMILSEVVKHSDIGLREDEAEAKVLKRLGVDSREEVEEMSATDKKLLKVEAKEARALLAREQEAARKTPERKTPADFLAQHQKTKAERDEAVRKAYEPIVGDIVKKVLEPIKDGDEVLFTEIPDEKYVEELKTYALTGAVQRGLDTSELSQQEVILNLRNKFIADNIAKIAKTIKTNTETAVRKEYDEKYVNHKPVGLQKEADGKPQPNTDVIKNLIESAPKTGW